MNKSLYLSLLICPALLVAQDNNGTNGKANNGKRTTQNGQSTVSEKNVNTGLSQENREALGKMLNQLLADEYTLYVKTQKYHWNVYGPFFEPLHNLFGKQYEQLQMNIDRIAERARALGIYADGTLAEFAQKSRLKEIPGQVPDANGMIQNLLDDHETVIRSLRQDLAKAWEEYGDMGTSNFLTDLLEQHEKTAWMLRATLKR